MDFWPNGIFFVQQRNAHSAGQTSMPNGPECIEQLNETLFIITIALIVQTKITGGS